MMASSSVSTSVAPSHSTNIADNEAVDSDFLDSWNPAGNGTISLENFVTTSDQSNGGTSNLHYQLDGKQQNGKDLLEVKDMPLKSSLENGFSPDDGCGLCEGKLCSPRLLSCLHVFCEICLDKLINTSRSIANVFNDKKSTIKCPTCGQDTSIGPEGAASLPFDYILSNMLDMFSIVNMSVLCTSCKTKENAIARCSDCANFLCPTCNTAHQFMRCFESHKVVAFEDLKKSSQTIPIHKPIFCQLHPTGNMKFYCYTCQKPICNECLLTEHKAPGHRYERLADAEAFQKDELTNLIAESKSKVAECKQASMEIGNVLCGLQSQRDQAKDLIIETFQSYRTVLEKCRDNALDDLAKLHSKRELEVMNTLHRVENTMDKIENACRFTSKLLTHGDPAEILMLKRVVADQLVNLINNTPKLTVETSIEFLTDHESFAAAMKEFFGKFKSNEVGKKEQHEVAITKPVSSPITYYQHQSPFQQRHHQQQLTPISCKNSLSTSSPKSLSNSMHSPLEDDTSFIIPSANSRSIKEYNLQKMTNFPDKVELNDVKLSANSNPTSAFMWTGDLSLANYGTDNAKMLGNSDSEQQTFNVGGGLVMRKDRPLGLQEASLNANTLMNGSHQSLSCTSPIFSQGQDDMKMDPMYNTGLGLSFGDFSNPGGANFKFPRPGASRPAAMQIRSKFGQLGPNKGQFNSPHGFCLGVDENIVIADTNNHRVQIFDKMGQFKAHFGIAGREEGQLWYPRKIAVVRSTGKFVVCDRGNERSRMQIFSKNGRFLRKIAIRYIDIVAGLAVNGEGQIVAVDSVTPTVFLISAENGNLLHWFDCSDYMREPSDIVINGKEYFVCDFKGHCVVVFNIEGHFLRRIGCENVINYPNGIDISNSGDILIGDSHGNRFHVVVFSREGLLISEFECPHVKVSRCCGLKLTSEGYIVTLAKNNHHVLILNTLYIS